MSKMNGGAKVGQEFVEKITADATSDLEVLTPEKQKELKEILYEYMPEARKFIAGLTREKKEEELLAQILSMRVAEYKVHEAGKCLDTALHYLNTGAFNKATKTEIQKALKELQQWFLTI